MPVLQAGMHHGRETHWRRILAETFSSEVRTPRRDADSPAKSPDSGVLKREPQHAVSRSAAILVGKKEKQVFRV